MAVDETPGILATEAESTVENAVYNIILSKHMEGGV